MKFYAIYVVWKIILKELECARSVVQKTFLLIILRNTLRLANIVVFSVTNYEHNTFGGIASVRFGYQLHPIFRVFFIPPEIQLLRRTIVGDRYSLAEPEQYIST